MNMNNEEKRQLDKMIQANNTVDNTSGIRNEKKVIEFASVFHSLKTLKESITIHVISIDSIKHVKRSVNIYLTITPIYMKNY